MVTAILSILGVALPPLLRLIEAKYPPKSGPAKLGDAAKIVRGAVDVLTASGAMQGKVSDVDIVNAIEAMVQALKVQGELGGATVPAVAGQFGPGKFTVTITPAS